MVAVNRVQDLAASTVSRRDRFGCLKGKHRLALGFLAHGCLQSVGRGEIDLHAKQITQVVPKTYHVDQSMATLRLEFGDQVNVG